eukprot:TRINITY_DN21960_c0_g1_i1.p1 TRINITY_DN21960_c0_g1~~TRINITY_DN21960_c0_g1_i1.p1  ORF type:complete len:310 (+),score=50.40 TRINITY_DN21960_c0_g1_i1:1119-2048(+)
MPRFDSQGILGLTIHLLGIYFIASSIVIVPSCDWKDVAVCGTGLAGQVSNANSTTKESCLPPSDGFQYTNFFWNLGHQVGFINGEPRTEACLLYGCKGCVRTETSCTNPAIVQHYCESSRAIGDIDPLAPFIYIGWILFGAILFFTNRDLLPTKRTLFSLVIVLFGVWIIEQSIAFKDSCAMSDATYDGCGGSQPDELKNDKIVSYTYCGVSGYTAFATNVPPVWVPGSKNTDPLCLTYGCQPRHCLRKTATCPTQADIAYECVSPGTLASAQPVNLFIGILMIVVGTLVWVLRDKSEDGLKYKYEEVA